MVIDELLRLGHRLESPYPSLFDPGRLVRLFGPIIGILLSDMDCLWGEASVGDGIAA